MDYASLLELVKGRRSLRRFKPDPLPEGTVERIVEVARWAPSGANSQPWEFVVVRQPEVREKIVELVKENQEMSRRLEATRPAEMRHPANLRPWSRPGWADAPALILLCGDPRTEAAYPFSAYLAHRDDIFTSSLASAFLYMHLAAAALGLGSQWVSATCQPQVQCLLKELLGIPQELEIYDTMAVGYPARTPRPRLVRPVEELLHYERYEQSKFRSPEAVRGFILQLIQERASREG